MTTMKDLINDFGIACKGIPDEIYMEIRGLMNEEEDSNTEILYDHEKIEKERLEELLDDLMIELKKFYD